MKTIVWDVDDVLNDLMRDWFRNAWMPSHPECPVKSYSQLKENPPHSILGVSSEEYLESLDAFRLTCAGSPLEPSKEVREWFASNGRRFRHVALSAVPATAAPIWSAWVLENFGEWIKVFAFAPSPRGGTQAHGETKVNVLRWLASPDIFVDDNEENVSAVAGLGIETFLFPRPWNSAHGTSGEALARLAAIS